MRFPVIVALAVLFGSISAQASETRCGWFENPTPSNAWLIDRHGEWVIGYQGGHQADGDWPDFADKDWVKINVHYGYGCACMDVVVDKKSKYVLRILRAWSKPLSACKNDKALPQR